MKVAKWGNSLAIRLPRPVVEALDLKEGDEVEVVAAEGALQVARDRSRDEALARMRALSFRLPPDYKFDREAANARGELSLGLGEADDT